MYKLTIECNSPEELAALVAKLSGNGPAAVVKAKPVTKTTPPPVPAPEPVVEEAEEDLMGGEEEEITEAELRKNASAVLKLGKKDAFKALLVKYKAKDLTAVKPENYKEMNDALIALM